MERPESRLTFWKGERCTKARFEVQRALAGFVGVIQQVPPRVSAIQIDGRRAYDLERKGKEFNLAARPVTVHNFTLTRLENAVYKYRIECGPGTYVRALARDLGAMLGCGGAVETLRRIASGVVDIAQGIRPEEVSGDTVRDWPALLPHLPVIDVPLQLARDLLQGREAALGQFESFVVQRAGEQVVYRCEGSVESCGILQHTDIGWRYLVSAMPQFGLGR
jgi:tRNA U55 pseudouridine synthase TruB